MRAAKRQHAHGFETDAGVAPRDDGGQPAEIEAGGDFFRRGLRAERAARRFRTGAERTRREACRDECATADQAFTRAAACESKRTRAADHARKLRFAGSENHRDTRYPRNTLSTSMMT